MPSLAAPSAPARHLLPVLCRPSGMTAANRSQSQHKPNEKCKQMIILTAACIIWNIVVKYGFIFELIRVLIAACLLRYFPKLEDGTTMVAVDSETYATHLVSREKSEIVARDDTMRVVVFSSQKGGSGKTTLCGHLAVQAERSGAGPVAVIDTDPQGSLAAWWNAREAGTPRFAQANLDYLHGDLEQMRRAGIRLVFIDTPPAVTDTIARIVAYADLVVVPTRPSPH
ncbi:MAG: ParA family protein, partial [Rhodospirillales bacterium]|nr:ParA family protein [Rhodospirillales bacterium]